MENRILLQNYKLFDDNWDITDESEEDEMQVKRRTTTKVMKNNDSGFKKKSNGTITVETVEKERKTKI